MMRNDNLLTIEHRELLYPTDHGNELEVYLNLASRLKVGGPDQLWIADITYIRLKTEFVYLAVVLDAFHPNALPIVPKPSRSSRAAALVFKNGRASQSAITRLLKTTRPFRADRFHVFCLHWTCPSCSGTASLATYSSANVQQLVWQFRQAIGYGANPI
jgi:hypothetical protein